MSGSKRMTAYPGLGAMIVALVCTLGFSQGPAFAAGCAPASGPQSAETTRLQRQISANRAFETKYGCLAGGGSFACREIRGRIAQASARLADLSGGTTSQCAAAVVVEKKPAPRRAAGPHVATIADVAPRGSAKVETMCVRLSDGYYFPTPNSGYNTLESLDRIAAQCKSICDDQAMEVFRMVGSDRNADDMVSLVSGTRYRDLPNAGAYRLSTVSRTCDMARFYKTTLAKMSPEDSRGRARITLNDGARPVATTVAMAGPLFSHVGLRGTRNFVREIPRKVRVVGALYLPDDR